MNKFLLYLSTILLLCSCTGKSFLHQRYTHYSHTKQRDDTYTVMTTEEEEQVAILQKKESSPAEPVQKKRIRSIRDQQENMPHKETVCLPQKISSKKAIQAKNTARTREQAKKAGTTASPDPFKLIAILIWILIALFLLALVIALIGLIVLLASHIVLGVTLLAIGVIGTILWLVIWG